MNEEVSSKIYKDSVVLGYDRFQTIYRKKFSYIYRAEYDGEDWICGCKEVDGRYFELYRDWTGKRVGGTVRYRYNILLQRVCLKRLLKKDTGADELYWNLYEETFGQGISTCRVVIDNTDKKITKGLLRKAVNEAMKLTPEKIQERYSETIAQLQDYAKEKHKAGIITAKGCRGSIPMFKGYRIASLYDASKTRKENIRLLAEYGINVSESTLRRYGFGTNSYKQEQRINNEKIMKELSRSTEYRLRKKKGEVHQRVSDEEVIKELDPRLGVNKNKKQLEDKGLYVSKARVSILMQKVGNIKESVVDSEETQTQNNAESGMIQFRIKNFADFFEKEPEEKKTTPEQEAELSFPSISFSTPNFSGMFGASLKDDTDYW